MSSGLFGLPNKVQAVLTSALTVLGKPGATAGAGLAGGTTSGAPTSGTFSIGDVVVDQTGKLWVCTASGSPGTWVAPAGIWSPSDNGVLTWTWDTSQNNTFFAPTAGIVYLQRVRLSSATSITNVEVCVVSAGVTLANCFLGIYNTSGTRIAVTANQSTIWTSTGTKTTALTGGPFSLNGDYWVAVLMGSGTTPPQFSGVTWYGNAVHATAGSSRLGQYGSAQTSLPSPLTPASIAASNVGFWAGLS